jgi:hypothetical protein
MEEKTLTEIINNKKELTNKKKKNVRLITRRNKNKRKLITVQYLNVGFAKKFFFLTN